MLISYCCYPSLFPAPYKKLIIRPPQSKNCSAVPVSRYHESFRYSLANSFHSSMRERLRGSIRKQFS